jgi:hypothetical protein
MSYVLPAIGQPGRYTEFLIAPRFILLMVSGSVNYLYLFADRIYDSSVNLTGLCCNGLRPNHTIVFMRTRAHTYCA